MGRKWARDVFVLCRNPVTMVAAHRGTAMLRFIDNWVVGVNEWGSRPSRFVDAMKMIRVTNMKVQVCPL